MKKFSTWIIIGLTVALVVVPVLSNQLEAEVARWHIAAAANASTLGKGTADEHLQKAENAFSDADQLRDYWLFEIKRGLIENPSSVYGIVERAIEKDKANVSLIPYAALGLWDREEFYEHVKVWELARKSGKRLSGEVLNQLAYSRSLAVRELDQALEDIDKALKSRPNEAAFRDTRAWVLFNMGRLSEALKDADFSVKSAEKAMQGDFVSRTVEALFGWLEPVANEQGDEKVLSREEAGERLWSIGALRYHRAKILEGLGRVEEAQKDWDWLEEHSLPKDDRLF